MNPKECANLTTNNWCLLRDAECHLLVKHEKYKFDSQDLKCNYLESIEPTKPETKLYSRKCKHCDSIFKTEKCNKLYCSDYCTKKARQATHKKYDSKRVK